MNELKRNLQIGELIYSCLDKLHWQADYLGFEVGYNHIPALGFYTYAFQGEGYGVYIDVDTHKVVEVRKLNEDE